MNQNPMDLFQKESPAVAKAFDGLIDSLRATTGLNDKMKQLIYIGLQASLGNSTAIYYHVPMAKKSRCYKGRSERCNTDHPDDLRFEGSYNMPARCA